MAETQLVIFFIYSSIFYCWLASVMATTGKPPVTWDVSRPDSQLRTAAGVYVVLLVMNILYKFVLMNILPVSPDTADLVFSLIMVAAGVAAVAAYGDGPGTAGLSFRNVQVTLLFFIPALATVFLPGGVMNWKLLLRDFTVLTFVMAFSEEFFLRGYIQTRLQAALGFFPGLVAASAAIALFHATMFLGAGFVTIFTTTVLSFLLWGLVAGMIFARVGNIYGLVVLRIFWEVTFLALVGFTVE